MDQATIQRYQPGGDIYAQLQAQYGTSGANQVAAAAATGDNNGEVAAALAQLNFGAPLDDSTTDAFLNQITTNPLGAPLSDLETVVSNTLKSLFTSPAILLVAIVALFFVFGGADVIRALMRKAAK